MKFCLHTWLNVTNVSLSYDLLCQLFASEMPNWAQCNIVAVSWFMSPDYVFFNLNYKTKPSVLAQKLRLQGMLTHSTKIAVHAKINILVCEKKCNFLSWNFLNYMWTFKRLQQLKCNTKEFFFVGIRTGSFSLCLQPYGCWSHLHNPAFWCHYITCYGLPTVSNIWVSYDPQESKYVAASLKRTYNSKRNIFFYFLSVSLFLYIFHNGVQPCMWSRWWKARV